jgi:hypothetical protein
LNQEELRGRFLGHFPYPDAKAERDRSMGRKHRLSEDVEESALQDPRDRVRARLLESESPWGVIFHPSITTSTIDAISYTDF